jgi:hypothetical protein
MRNLVVAVALSLAVSACWNMKKTQMANYLENNASLNICLEDKGVNPGRALACLRDSPDEASARECVHGAYTSDEASAFKRCGLEEEAREQAATHTTTCYPILGSVTCTGN